MLTDNTGFKFYCKNILKNIFNQVAIDIFGSAERIL